MSPILRFWLHVIGAGCVPMITTLIALWTQAMAEGTRVPLYGYLIALGGGVVAAYMEGQKSWPTDPVVTHQRDARLGGRHNL